MCSKTVSDADMLSGSHRDRYHRLLGAFLHVLASPLDGDTKPNEQTMETKEISKKTVYHLDKPKQPLAQTSGSASTAPTQVQPISQTLSETHHAALENQTRESDHI